MDSVIKNKYSDILSSLNIEVSKELEGEYDVEEIINTFSNFFFNKMFLDITAIKDYKDITNLQKLSMNINMDKVILLLDKEDEISDSKAFLSQLVSMGIYNFTKDSNNLMYLYNNPNSYKDVAYLHNVDNVVAEETTSIITDENSPKIILGVKNITDEAGATTLIYLLKKVLSDYYKVMAIELDKRDFIYFKEDNLISIKENELDSIIDKNPDINIFLIDLNKSRRESICTDIIYLIEPSTIKLNKLVLINKNIFNELNSKKVILNKSLLNDNDIANFEVESDIKIFYNIPPINDKEDQSKIFLPFLEKLGYIKPVSNEEEPTPKKKSFFNLFK